MTRVGINVPLHLKNNQVLDIDFTDDRYQTILEFIQRCRVSFAITQDVALCPQYIQEFYRNMNRVIHNGVVTLVTRVNNMEIHFNACDIRRILRLGTAADEEGPTLFPTNFIAGGLRRMGFVGDIDEHATYIKKGGLYGQWRFLAHVLIVVFGTRKAGFDDLMFDTASAMLALVYNKSYSFSQYIFSKIEKVVTGAARAKIAVYPRFVMMIINDLLPNLPNVASTRATVIDRGQIYVACQKNSSYRGLEMVETPMFGSVLNVGYVAPPNNGWEDVTVEEDINVKLITDGSQVVKEHSDEEVDPVINMSPKSVMSYGVNVLGNEEASVDPEPPKKPEEEEDTNQQSLNKEDSDDSDADKESKPEEQTSKNRGKNTNTIINSAEPSAKKGNSKKKDVGRKRGCGKNSTDNDQAKAMSSDVEMEDSPKYPAKSGKGEGNSKKRRVNSAKRKRSAVKDNVTDTIKYDKSLVGSKIKVWSPENEMYYEAVIESFYAAKKKHTVLYLDGEKEILNLKTEKWEIIEEYSVRDEEVLPVSRKLGGEVSLKSTDKLKMASVCETAPVEHNDENASGLQPASKSKLEKESKYKADESKLTTASSDHSGRVFKQGACPEEVGPTLDRSLQSAMIIGVDVTGNQETSTEPMAGLCHKRATRETSDGSAKKRRVASVEGRESDSTPSGHLPRVSTPATEERARQMGPSGFVDRLKESAALFSHAAESIHALELDNSELKRQVLRDKGYHEKISVLEREIADLKSLNDQMKLTYEARAVDAERRATEVERRFAEYKREMEAENFKLKKQVDEYADHGYKEKIRILEKEVEHRKSLEFSVGVWATDAEKRATEAEKKLAEAKKKMVEAKAALASFAL